MFVRDKFKYLQGKKLLKISTNEDEADISFHTAEGMVNFNAYGACCSSSWIETFESPSEPCVIIEVKEIPIPPSFDYPKTKTDNDEEEMEYYFYEVLTDKGSFLIEMRNSSNGYYGGWLE